MKEYPNYNENFKTVICKNIKKFIKEKNVSEEELSKKIGISLEHLKRIESETDRNNISLLTLYKISIVLGVRIDNFLIE